MSYIIPAKELSRYLDIELLIVAEGAAEAGLASQYLDIKKVHSEKAKVVMYEGNKKVAAFTKTLLPVLEELSKFTSICVVADSEDDPKARLAAFADMGEQLGFKGCRRPIHDKGRYTSGVKKFAVSLSPTNNTAGCVEDLILAELSGSILQACFKDGFACPSFFGAKPMSPKGRVAVLTAALLENGRSGARDAFLQKKLNVLSKAYKQHRDALDFAMPVAVV